MPLGQGASVQEPTPASISHTGDSAKTRGSCKLSLRQAARKPGPADGRAGFFKLSAIYNIKWRSGEDVAACLACIEKGPDDPATTMPPASPACKQHNQAHGRRPYHATSAVACLPPRRRLPRLCASRVGRHHALWRQGPRSRPSAFGTLPPRQSVSTPVDARTVSQAPAMTCNLCARGHREHRKTGQNAQR